MPLPHETAAAETETIVHRAIPSGRRTLGRDDLRAIVHPLTVRCAEQAARIAELERRLKTAREDARRGLDELLVEFVNGG